MKAQNMIAHWEYTDTFGGEANYSWVRRGEVALPDGASDTQITRLVKKDAGLNGVRMVRQSFGDFIELRPLGICAVLFINLQPE